MAIDAYADAQTVALCKQTCIVDYDERGFNAHALQVALGSLDLSEFVGFAYGSGFEAQPMILREIALMLPLIGNLAEVVANVKNPISFFATLQTHHIQHPPVFLRATANSTNKLIKTIGGSGGSHIQNADLSALNNKSYLQQKIEGDAVSLLFIANTQTIKPIGFNMQWLTPAPDKPYRYGGAASNAALSSIVKAQLVFAAEKITQAFGLLGLNSLDAIVKLDDKGEQVFVLEINPRLSATVDLYIDATHNLFEQHVQACINHILFEQQEAVQSVSRAHAVVYADTEICFNADFVWPFWVKDYPSSAKKIYKIHHGEPVCTVTAEAKTAQAASAMAQARVDEILQLLKQK